MKIFKFMFYSGLIFSGLGVMSEDEEMRKYFRSVIKKLEPQALDLLKKVDYILSDIENINTEKLEVVSKNKYKELKKLFDNIDEEKIKELGLITINNFKNKLNNAENELKTDKSEKPKEDKEEKVKKQKKEKVKKQKKEKVKKQKKEKVKKQKKKKLKK